MPYEEEEDRGCEVKCPKGGGVCGIGSTPILLPNAKRKHLPSYRYIPMIPQTHVGETPQRVRGLQTSWNNNYIIAFSVERFFSCNLQEHFRLSDFSLATCKGIFG